MPDVPARVGATSLGGLGRRKVGVDVPDSKLGLSIPLLTIQHKVDREQQKRGLEAGSWVYRKQSLGDMVHVTFLKVGMTRAYVVREGKKAQTLCASSDGHVPLPEIVKPQAPECWTCPCSQWTGPDGAREKPLCDQTYAFFGVLRDMQDAPFWFRSSSSKMSRIRAEEFITDFKLDPEAEALHQWVVELRLDVDGQWYVPRYTVMELLPVDHYRALYEQVRDLKYVPFIGRDVIDQDDHEPDPTRAKDVTPPAGWQEPPPLDDDIPF